MSPAIPEMERYRQITPGSRALWERAARVLPGADTRSSIYWRPYPIYPMDSGDIATYAESLGRVVTHLGSALSRVGT